jgi:hypothetical protein
MGTWGTYYMGVLGHGETADSCTEERRAGAQPRWRIYFALAHEACADSAEQRFAGSRVVADRARARAELTVCAARGPLTSGRPGRDLRVWIEGT